MLELITLFMLLEDVKKKLAVLPIGTYQRFVRQDGINQVWVLYAPSEEAYRSCKTCSPTW
jgi:hypothetical protein